MNKQNTFCTSNIRTMRFLYNLGFDKQSVINNGIEQWIFQRTPELNESLDFFFYMRKKIFRNMQEMNREYENERKDSRDT